ncbi:MAG: DUF4430 domain-containing protein [Thermoplasmata archaeon]
MTARLGDPRLALLLALAIVLSVAGLWAALRALAPAPVPPATVSVTMHIETGDWDLFYSATSTNNTVLSFLLEASAEKGFPVQYQYWEDLGASKVNGINRIRDGSGGLFWQYWVNGAYGQVGADRYILADGDAVLWRHAVYPPEA